MLEEGFGVLNNERDKSVHLSRELEGIDIRTEVNAVQMSLNEIQSVLGDEVQKKSQFEKGERTCRDWVRGT